MSYDTWKTTNPDDERLGRSDGRPVRYRCEDCSWQGGGCEKMAAHARQTGHRVRPASDPRFAHMQKPARTA